jgi:hypothetical protein
MGQTCHEVAKKSSKIVPLGASSWPGVQTGSLFPGICRRPELESSQIVQAGEPCLARFELDASGVRLGSGEEQTPAESSLLITAMRTAL